jgi:hypothetical protein
MSYVIKLQIVLQVQIAIKAQIIENVCFICKSYVLKDFFLFEKDLVSYTLCGRRPDTYQRVRQSNSAVGLVSTSSHTDFGLLAALRRTRRQRYHEWK